MFSVIGLVGSRQVGKSTTLKKLFKNYNYITFDDSEIRAYANNFPKDFIKYIETPCIIDEAQYAPDIFSYIKIRVDEDPALKGQFILTGSQNFMLLRNIAESLAGRIGLLNMYTLSLEEIINYKKGRNNKNLFFEICKKGTYPEPFVSKNIDANKWYESYKKVYVERDLKMIYNIGKIDKFENFVDILASQVGRLLNLNSISKNIGVSVNTLKDWISILEASGIIILVSPYYRNITKKVVKTPKVYFIDTGFVCKTQNLYNKNQIEKSHYYGRLFENLWVVETIKFFKNRGENVEVYFFRDHAGLEIDLLIKIKNKFIPIEIKNTHTIQNKMAKNIENFILKYRNIPLEHGFILYNGEKEKISEFVTAIGEKDFLLLLKSMLK